eukprot:2296342-Pyramimonas_sp.AAC.1
MASVPSSPRRVLLYGAELFMIRRRRESLAQEQVLDSWAYFCVNFLRKGQVGLLPGTGDP